MKHHPSSTEAGRKLAPARTNSSTAGTERDLSGHAWRTGPLEMEVLDILWELGEATSRDIFEAMRDRDIRLGQTTVNTVLLRLTGRGLIQREPGQGPLICKPLVSRDELGGLLIDIVVARVYRGDARRALGHLRRQIPGN